jgi:hypothetical protein
MGFVDDEGSGHEWLLLCEEMDRARAVTVARKSQRILSDMIVPGEARIVACIGCPYLQHYDLIWREPGAPDVMCVMLWCCAGPELQIRRGEEVLVDEFYSSRELVYERAGALRGEFTGSAGSP